MSVIGVDFGTKNCVIAQAKRGGIDTALNEGSKRQTAALVSFQGKQRFMGEAAVPLISSNFKNTVSSVKRFIGRGWNDPGVQEEISRLPNKAAFQEIDDGRIGIAVNYNDSKVVFRPEDICAMLISSLKLTAEHANDGRPVTDIVFSVPSFWTDRQKRSFLTSAKIANVGVLGLIGDGVATALSYGIWKSASNQFKADEKDYVMFVDMGYASFQVTIASFVQGKLEVVGYAADENLGGRDIDWILANHFAEQFKEKYKDDPMTNPKSLLKLMTNCEKLKQTLTPEGVSLAKLNIEFLMNEIDFNSQMDLETFNEKISGLVDRVESPLQRALEESKLTMDQISAVEIVGGGTRVRAIKERIANVLGLDTSKLNYGLSTTQNADECVARGCALRCAMLSPAFRVKEFLVEDSVLYPVELTWEQTESAGAEDDAEDDVKVAGENSIVILPKGSSTPKTRRVTFRRSEKFEIVAAYSEDAKKDMPKDTTNLLIGTFEVSGMPAPKEDAGPARIRLDFKQDEYGLFGISSAKCMEEVITEEPAADEAKMETDKEAEPKEEKEGAGGEEKMEQDAPADEKKEEEAPKKKKKTFNSIPLKVVTEMFGAYSEDEMMNARAREEGFVAQDKVLKATADTRNELEAYLYSMRDKVRYGELKEYTTEQEREEFIGQLETAENWLYDEGFDETKAVYEGRLKDLRKSGDRFVHRMTEASDRPKFAQNLRDEMSKILAVVNSVDEKYAHIDEDEREKVRKSCADAEAWLKEQLDLQAEKNLFEDPVFGCSEIETRTNDMRYACRPIVTKRKPPTPKKKEEKPAAEEKAADAKAEETTEPMESEETSTDKAEEAGGEKKDEENDMDVD